MNQCIACKGRGRCGRPRCPILERFKALLELPPLPDSNLFGDSPPGVFVGRIGYPKVRAGPLVPLQPGDTGYNNPALWAEKDLKEIITLSTSLVRSSITVSVKDLEHPLLAGAQEIAMAERPVETEVWFNRPPVKHIAFDSITTPLGPTGEIRKLEITENPRIPRKIDSLVNDTHVTASTAILELYKNRVDTPHLSRLLSIGLLGKKRKLVPTRWSITATDDILGKHLAEKIQTYPQISETQVFTGELLGNHFEILLTPAPYSFELIEIWQPRGVWSQQLWIEGDRENSQGKKTYSNLGGGYYAARLPILEYLAKTRRTASILAIREVKPSYWAPLGVWVVREAARKAMQNPPKKFPTPEQAIQDMATRIQTHQSHWKPKIRHLTQKTLTDYNH